jgi:type I restriction enzyme S subunit
MVLRARPEVVVPDFLPFFMQSDRFMDRALEISVGSLSPTINSKTLAAEEFSIPSLEEQIRLVKVLSSAQDSVEELRSLRDTSDALLCSIRNHLIPHPRSSDVATIGDFARLGSR